MNTSCDACGVAAAPIASSGAVPSSPEHIYALYAADRLVLHSIPSPCTEQRDKCFRDSSSLMSGSVLFFKGLRHQSSGQQVGCGVARFGDRDRVNQTVFASLHDLERVWESHARMEAAKPPHRRHPGGPYVFFAHNDMANTANACGGQPPPSYCDCHPGGPGPECLLRTRGFDFRGHCERQPLPHLPAEAEARGIEWNELRAALSYDNLVGLAFIHDPEHDPRQHAGAAEALRRRVAAAAAEAAREAALARSCEAAAAHSGGQQTESAAPQTSNKGGDVCGSSCGNRGGGGAAAAAEAAEAAGSAAAAGVGEGALTSPAVPRLEMFVFVLEQEHGVNGHLLVEEQEVEVDVEVGQVEEQRQREGQEEDQQQQERGEAGPRAAEVGEGGVCGRIRQQRRVELRGRAVTFGEYLERWRRRREFGKEAAEARGEVSPEPAGVEVAEA